MNIQTLIGILETDLTRTTLSTKKEPILSYQGNNFTTTYTIDSTETELTQCRQICINHNNNTIQIYINHTHRHTLKKLTLSDITNLTITTT